MLIAKNKAAGACSASFPSIWYRLFALLTLGLLISSPSHALTFAVNSTSDAVDANPGNGACATSTGACTLRAAIQEANALAGADTITLQGTTYTLSITGTGENSAARGDLDVTGGGDLTINGVNPSSTRILAGGGGFFSSTPIDRVFHFIGRNNVTINNVSIENGYITGAKSNGGGIFNEAAWVTLSNCQVLNSVTTWDGNNGSGGQGGGVYNAAGAKMTINNCTFRGNKANTGSNSSENAFNGGGAIYNGGEMIVSNSVIDANTASRFGAGVMNYTGTLTINTSIISGNTGPAIDTSGFGGASGAGAGGGIANFSGQVTLRDSRVSGNRSMEGGGIYNYPAGPLQARVVVISSAITANGADMWGGGVSNWDRMNVFYSAVTANVVGASGGQFSFNGVFMGEGGGFSNMGIGDLLVQHSTISGNTVARAGGGVFNGAKVRLVHVTLKNNKAASGPLCTGGAGIDFSGGSFTGCSGSYVFGNEVFNSSSASSSNKGIIFERTIIGGGASPVGNCLAGDADTDGFKAALRKLAPFTATSNGYNIDSGNTCALPTAAGTTDKVSTDPGIAVLADFGGGATLPGGGKVPQSLHLPNAGSPAINAIPNTLCPKLGVDQRLYVRPDAASGKCDIGSVEANSTKANLADLNVAVTFASSAASLKAAAGSSAADMRYAIAVTNDGPDNVTDAITLTQVFDADVSLVGFGPRDTANLGCMLTDTKTVTCSYRGGLVVGSSFSAYITVRPVDSTLKSLSSTSTVSYPELNATVDPVPGNDSVTVVRAVTAALEPFPDSASSGGGFSSGGGGAFGVLPLALLGVFGVLLGYRRRVSCKA